MGTLQTKYESFLFGGFIEDFKIGQKLYKITHNSMKNRGSNPSLTKLVGVHPRNIYTKLERNLCSDLKEVENAKVHDADNNDDGHRVIARVTLTH